MTAGALYYPYIHIRDARWLKANLLIFPKVQRMIPFEFNPDDSEEIKKFAQWRPGAEPLLQPADLFSKRSIDAQEGLANRLRRDAEHPAFLKRYGREATREWLPRTEPGLQIHVDKLSPLLRSV